jgi:hypothetical protein
MAHRIIMNLITELPLFLSLTFTAQKSKESRFYATAVASSIASSNPSFEQYPFKYFSALLEIVLALDVCGYILQNFVGHIKLS